MPAGLERQRRIIGGMRLTATKRTAMGIVLAELRLKALIRKRRHGLDRMMPIHGVFTICMATYGSGAQIGMGRIRKELKLILQV